jgi:hypothetical protein
MAGLFGSAGLAGKYNPSALSPQDRLMLLGATLSDTGSALRGGQGASVLNTRALLAAQQQMQRQAQFLQSLNQPQYQDGPPPVVALPPGPAEPSPSIKAAAPGLFGSQAPQGPQDTASNYQYQPPVRTANSALTLDNPNLANLAVMGKNLMGVDLGPGIDALKAQQPDVALGPDGTPYNKKSMAGLPAHFRNPTNVNNTIVDLNNPDNEGMNVPSAPVPGARAVYDNRGRIVDWELPSGAARAIGAAEAAKTGAQEAAKLPYVGPSAEAAAAGTARGGAPYNLLTKDVNGVPTTMTQAQALGLAGGSGDTPRGIRNNNPGNLRPLGNGQWSGQVGVDGGNYAQFATPEAGIAAAEQNLLAKQSRHGLQTVQQIIADPKWGWDPGNAAYAGTVAKALGVTPGTPVNLADPRVRQAMLGAIFQVENGRAVPQGRQAAAPGFHGINPDDAKKVATYQEDARSAEDVVTKAHQFQELNKKTYTGPLFNPVRVHIPLLGDVPLNPASGIGSAFQPGSQAMDNLSMQMATGLRAPGQRLTQAEIFQNLKTVPNRRSLPDQNDASVGGYEKQAATKRAYANFMSNYLAQNGSLTGADEAWSAQQRAAAKPAPRVRVYNPKTGNLE